jgi:hypothetical protein
MTMVSFIQVGLGFSPDVATEAATHLRFAFNGERETDNGKRYFRSRQLVLPIVPYPRRSVRHNVIGLSPWQIVIG